MKAQILSIDYKNPKTGRKIHFSIDIFKKPNNIKEYSRCEKILDDLIDEVRGDEKHPLAIAMQIIGENLEQYDNEHYSDVGMK